MSTQADIQDVVADIKEDGALCTYATFDFTGPETVPDETPNIFIVLLPVSEALTNPYFKAFVGGSNVPSGTCFGLMANNGFKPKVDDQVTVTATGDVYKISRFDVLQPSGVPLLYLLELAQ